MVNLCKLPYVIMIQRIHLKKSSTSYNSANISFFFFFVMLFLPRRQRQQEAVFQLYPVTQSQYVQFNSWVAGAGARVSFLPKKTQQQPVALIKPFHGSPRMESVHSIRKFWHTYINCKCIILWSQMFYVFFAIALNTIYDKCFINDWTHISMSLTKPMPRMGCKKERLCGHSDVNKNIILILDAVYVAKSYTLHAVRLRIKVRKQGWQCKQRWLSTLVGTQVICMPHVYCQHTYVNQSHTYLHDSNQLEVIKFLLPNYPFSSW